VLQAQQQGRFYPQSKDGGIDRAVSANELVFSQGGITIAAAGLRQGYIGTSNALIDVRRRSSIR